MSPRTIAELVHREVSLLRDDMTVADAVQSVLESRLPALPVVDRNEKLVGIFGEREFMSALFPGYLSELGYAGFVTSTLDDAIEKRAACAHERVGEHMNTEHVDVERDFSDVGVAEIFLHHDALVIPVLDAGKVVGVITRPAFFRRLGSRFLSWT